MQLKIINLLPESSHKNVIDNGYITSRASSVVGSWFSGDPAVCYDVATDGSYLYCEDYLSPRTNVLVGETVNDRKILYDCHCPFSVLRCSTPKKLPSRV